MKHSKLILLFLIEIYTSFAEGSKLLPEFKNCGQLSSADRISGGKNAGLTEYPWLALIEYEHNDAGNANNTSPNFACGGTLINSKYVITSAHCFLNHKKAVSVRLGEHNIITAPDCQSFGPETFCNEPVQNIAIEKITIHENYVINVKRKDYRGGQNDIALIRLKEAAIFNTRSVTPICLPTAENTQQIGLSKKKKRLYVAGWGLTSNGTTADVKQTLNVPIVDWKTCDKQFPNRIISSAQMCAGGEVGKDACKGDSGGPLMTQATVLGKSFFYLLGIVSYGPPCGTSLSNPRPSVYVKVDKYMEWIEGNVYE